MLLERVNVIDVYSTADAQRTDEGQIDKQHSCKAFSFAGINVLLFSNSRTVKKSIFFFYRCQCKEEFSLY